MTDSFYKALESCAFTVSFGAVERCLQCGLVLNWTAPQGVSPVRPPAHSKEECDRRLVEKVHEL